MSFVINFYTLFDRLKKNRQAIPLGVLKTQYAHQYEALVAEVIHAADQWAAEFFFQMRPPEKAGGASEHEPEYKIYRKAFIKVLMDDSFAHRYQTALVDDLNEWAFQEACCDWVREAWKVYPDYFQSHCHFTEDGRIYNDIVDLYWYERLGAWGTAEGVMDTRYFPLPKPPKNPKQYYRQGSLLDGG